MTLDAAQSRLAGLLARSALGDRPAFAELYRATSSKLFAVSLRIVRERPLAEEALQDSFVSIWKHAGDYAQAKSAPTTWMTAIVRNRSLDIVRRTREEPDVDDALAANLADERAVELEAEGDEQAVEALTAAVRRGPAGARVESVHIEVIPLAGESDGFRVTY